MRVQPWNTGWIVMTSQPRMGFGMQAEGTPVTLPHDVTIHTDSFAGAPGGAATGYYGGGEGISAPSTSRVSRGLAGSDRAGAAATASSAMPRSASTATWPPCTHTATPPSWPT